MPNRGYFFCLFGFLLGLPFIHGDCVENGYCKREAEDKSACGVYRHDYGSPIPSYTVSRTCGTDGPLLIEDLAYFQAMTAYVREKPPDRIGHSKGTGAWGYFEVTHDISEYTKAAMFSHVGKKTPVFCRLSPSGAQRGKQDTLRSHAGLTCKFYTTEGNWDLVAINQPVFFVRDPILYVSFVHIGGRNPVTGRIDANMTWDFYTKRKESVAAILHNYSDRGTPYGYRHMNGYGVHAFVFVNKHNKPTYVKFNWETLQGIKNFTIDEAEKMAGKEPDFFSKDLYGSISAGHYPWWSMCVQMMSFEQAEKVKFNPLDATTLWPEHEFPCRPIGKMVLNKNPTNWYAEVEQSAFSPANLVPGIEPSNDRILQGRLYAYTDAQRYRLGINYNQLPVNRPREVPCCPHSIDRAGLMNFYNQEGEPPYFPNSWTHLHPDPNALFRHYKTDGQVGRHDLGDQADYEQAKHIFGKYSAQDQEHIAKNIGHEIEDVRKSVQCEVIKLMGGVSQQLAAGIARYGNVQNWQKCLK